MRRYEVTCVLAPTLSPEEVEQAVESFKKTAEDKGATVVDVDNWGKRRLAFPVKKHTEGFYVIYTLDEEAAEAATEMERRFKVTDPVIRFLTVRIDEAQKRTQKLKAQRETRRKVRKASLEAARAAEVAPSAEAAEEPGEAAQPQQEPQAPQEKEQAASEKAAEKPESEPESSAQSEEQAPAEEAPSSEEKE